MWIDFCRYKNTTDWIYIAWLWSGTWSVYPNLYPLNPPTPAFAKAGAAPGTTAGVELVFLSNRHPKATSMASYGRPAQAIATRRPDPSRLLGGPACVRQAFAANRHPKATPAASYGSPSFFWAVQRAGRQAFAANRHPKATSLASYGRPSFFWAVQSAVRQAFAANRHPKATSMASYGRPSLPFASP